MRWTASFSIASTLDQKVVMAWRHWFELLSSKGSKSSAGRKATRARTRCTTSSMTWQNGGKCEGRKDWLLLYLGGWEHGLDSRNQHLPTGFFSCRLLKPYLRVSSDGLELVTKNVAELLHDKGNVMEILHYSGMSVKQKEGFMSHK